MSCILYYSNYCNNSKTLLQKLSSSSVKNDMHFLCIDKRIKKDNNSLYIQLENGKEILLPPTINKVPALLLLNNGHRVLFGEEIANYLEPKQIASQKIATQNNDEPMAFSLGGGGCYGVTSDYYSFLDQNSDELSTKGNGGMRQQHTYLTINDNITIETPPDTYSPDKIGKDSMEQLEQKRMTDIKFNK